MNHGHPRPWLRLHLSLIGAAAIRCQGLSDISAIKGRVEVVIGLWKGHEGVYIAPTLRHALVFTQVQMLLP